MLHRPPQLTRGPQHRAAPLGWPNLPFVVPRPLPSPPPPSSRWMTPAASRGQLRRRSPPLLLLPPAPQAFGPEPQRKSAAVHRGNAVLPGVSAQPGTICPGALTYSQHCQGGFPVTCCTPQALWARPGTTDRSIILRLDTEEETLCLCHELSLKELQQWVN